MGGRYIWRSVHCIVSFSFRSGSCGDILIILLHSLQRFCILFTTVNTRLIAISNAFNWKDGTQAAAAVQQEDLISLWGWFKRKSLFWWIIRENQWKKSFRIIPPIGLYKEKHPLYHFDGKPCLASTIEETLYNNTRPDIDQTKRGHGQTGAEIAPVSARHLPSIYWLHSSDRTVLSVCRCRCRRRVSVISPLHVSEK